MSTTRQSSRAVLTLSLIGVLSGYAWAAGRSDVQQNNNKPTRHESRMSSQRDMNVQGSSVTLERASHLIGHTVKGSDGKILGRIYDIVLTPDLDSVSYVALSRGGAFGLGNELYAVPWSAFSMGPGNTYFLPITENHLLTMTGFKEAYWPASPSAGWVAAAGTTGTSLDRPITRDASREIQHRRASKLMGTNVKDAQGTRSGNIRDFVIEKDTGQIAYSIVSYGGFLGLGNKFAAVPPTAINIDPQRHVARLTVDRSTLVASSFSPMRWPDLSSPTFEQRVATLYGTQPPSGAILGYVPPERNMPESNVNVQPKARMHGTKESTCEQGSALGYQAPAREPAREYEAPAATPQAPGTATFNPANVQTIEGTVVDTGKLGGTAGAGMLALRLKTADDKIVTVNLGPRDYISKQNLYIVHGDHIAVTGAQATIDGRPMFIATDIRSDGQVLHLRDHNGRPLWLQSASTQAEENEGVSAATRVPEESSME